MLDRLKEYFQYEEYCSIQQEQMSSVVNNSHWNDHLHRMESFKLSLNASLSIEDSGVVAIRSSEDEEMVIRPQLSEIVTGLLPWRKGPFNLCGVEIDAEWRSDVKWNRFAEYLPELRNRRVADVGSNNCYYLYRMLPYDPQIAVGFDPSSRCYYQCDLFNRLLPDPRICFEPLGIEHMSPFAQFFDVVLCMGVLYHRKDPYTSCRMLFDMLRKDGVLLLESIIVPGDSPQCLCPPGRYAKMRNVWYLPTDSCLEVWLEKAGFEDIEIISSAIVTTKEEQRQTVLAPYESLADFLDPDDPSRTIEGLPAPRRSIVRAVKR